MVLKKISQRAKSRSYGTAVFIESGEGNSPRHHIERIKRRIRKKRLQGRRLGALESYFSIRGLRFGSNLLGPSKVSTFFEVLSAFARPIPIVALLSLIIAAEGTTSAYFRASDVAEDYARENSHFAIAAIPEINLEETSELEQDIDQEPSSPTEEVALVAAAKDDGEPYDFERNYGTPDKLRGLVEFISGVIAVYRPSEKNAGEFARHIVEQAHAQQIDPLYVASVIAVESSFRSGVRSKVGATGLMQVMPATAKDIIKRHNVSGGKGRLTDPRKNIELGITYLKHLEKNYGSRDLALRAYNWGPNNVSKARKGEKRTPGSVKQYARKILELTHRWNKHFSRASENAVELQQSLLSNAGAGTKTT